MSNLRLGHGSAPVNAIRGAGIPLGVGSDSMASNGRMDVWREAMMAVRNGGGGPFETSSEDVLATATIGGATALGLAHEIGSLEPGKQADLAALPVGIMGERGWSSPFTELEPVTAGAPATPPSFPASLVVVAGRPLIRDGRVLADDESLQSRVTDAAAGLSARTRRSGDR
jgi:cytosine/adenosine deaminase-related metal-dependent hydrolase